MLSLAVIQTFACLLDAIVILDVTQEAFNYCREPYQKKTFGEEVKLIVSESLAYIYIIMY